LVLDAATSTTEILIREVGSSGPDAGACFVTESMAEGGQTQMGPAYATEAEATTAMASIPECQAVNTDPDPDEND
jgi:hypothetical protein